jgi:hypothetical protein
MVRVLPPWSPDSAYPRFPERAVWNFASRPLRRGAPGVGHLDARRRCAKAAKISIATRWAQFTVVSA